MIERKIKKVLLKAARGFPVLTITGPRQSGKTTLVRSCFPDYRYINLENPETKSLAISDPKSIFEHFDRGIIIDEIQNVPELLSWAQVYVDEKQLPGKLILTGSNQFEYMKDIGQTLAGRTVVLKLLPLSFEETTPHKDANWEYHVSKGSYPRLYSEEIDHQLYYSSYVMTYLERDIRASMQIRNLREFERFISLAASRTGQLVNQSSLAIDCGVDQKTIASWLNLLEASYVIYLMKPYHTNLNKRLIKTPKLYFFDTGLVSYLLGIRNERDLLSHPLRGELFETMIVSECLKYFHNRGIVPPISFFRDSQGHEIDLIVSLASRIIPVEIKSGKTINRDYFKNIKYLRKLMGKEMSAGILFADRRTEKVQDTLVKGWDAVHELMDEIYK